MQDLGGMTALHTYSSSLASCWLFWSTLATVGLYKHKIHTSAETDPQLVMMDKCALETVKTLTKFQS